MATTNEIASEIEIFLIKLPNLFFPYFKNWVNPTRKVTTKANGICHLLKCAITSEFGASLPSASDLKPSIFVSLNKSINGPPNGSARIFQRSEEHTSELQSRPHLVCRLLLEKKKQNKL